VPVPTGFNVILGTNHSDRLPGTAGRDAIFGFAGHRDVLIGRGGRDRLYGMRGHDVIRAVDGRRDLVVGGPGRDRCVVDAIDVVRSCETIVVR
jgi:Ca2+-binding RTX toxin-like protein